MAKAGRGQTRRDSKRRVLRPGESVRADGKYQYKYHIDGNIKKVLNYNKNRIIKKKEELSISYYNKSWVRSYFNDKGEFNYNKL